jgi:putative two-component system response regulator
MEIIEKDPNIDIMILDLNMPRMNGFEVLKTMNSKPEYKK